MKTALVCALAVTVGLGLAVTPLWAHHSFAAEFDGAKAVDLGTVTKVDWVNWDLETGPPNVLYRGGWRRDTVQITTPDGRRLFAGWPDNGPKQ
jgi:hypothetical protein